MGHHHDHVTEKVCIKTRKVYDWVSRQENLQLSFTNGDISALFSGCKKDPFQVLNNTCNAEVNCTVNTNSLVCEEIMQPGGRPSVTVTLPNGDEVTLQRVRILVRGTVTVEILNEAGQVICTSAPIPFMRILTFLLCAPEGTVIDCHVFAAECTADLICGTGFAQLDIFITLCIDVQVEADVKLEIEARFCTPREEIVAPATICPVSQFPPQCPEVFPG